MPSADVDFNDGITSTTNGWAAACPPSSPLRQAYVNNISSSRPKAHNQPSSPNHTFIHSHPTSMDPCLHPSHTNLNAFFSTRQTLNPTFTPDISLFPAFSICTTSRTSDVLLVP